MYFPEADYDILSPLTIINDALEVGDHLFIISNNILVIYHKNELI